MGLSNRIGPGHCYPGPSAQLGHPVTPLSPRPCRAEPLRPHRCFPRHGTAIIFWLLRSCTNTRTGSHGGSEVATDGFGGSRSPWPCGAPGGAAAPKAIGVGVRLGGHSLLLLVRCSLGTAFAAHPLARFMAIGAPGRAAGGVPAEAALGQRLLPAAMRCGSARGPRAARELIDGQGNSSILNFISRGRQLLSLPLPGVPL